MFFFVLFAFFLSSLEICKLNKWNLTDKKINKTDLLLWCTNSENVCGLFCMTKGKVNYHEDESKSAQIQRKGRRISELWREAAVWSENSLIWFVMSLFSLRTAASLYRIEYRWNRMYRMELKALLSFPLSFVSIRHHLWQCRLQNKVPWCFQWNAFILKISAKAKTNWRHNIWVNEPNKVCQEWIIKLWT